MHAHQCTACKRVWFHSEEMKGNEAAHRCVCGAVQWQQFSPAAQELRVGNIALAQNSGSHVSALADKLNTIMEFAAWSLIVVAAGMLVYQIAIQIRNAKAAA